LEKQNKILLEEISESRVNLENIQRESIKIILKAKQKDVRMLEQIRDDNSEMADKINDLSRLLEDSHNRERRYRRMEHQHSEQNNCTIM
jgi:hypothetical protein